MSVESEEDSTTLQRSAGAAAFASLPRGGPTSQPPAAMVMESDMEVTSGGGAVLVADVERSGGAAAFAQVRGLIRINTRAAFTQT